jgi:phosphatidylglycerophosphate synthase
MRIVQTPPVTVLIAQLLLLGGLAVTVGLSGAGLSPAAWAVGVSCGAITSAALARGFSYYRAARVSPADWVTLLRVTLAVGIAALVADSFGEPARVPLIVSLASVALVLDTVDGWVARRTQTSGTLGARLDGEVDALLILVLSVYVARWVGAWVLAIGAARYAFGAAGWVLPWMRQPLPPRYWRKFVAATQGIVLTVAAANILPATVTTGALIGALILLTESFGRDVSWLRGNRERLQPRIVEPSPGDKADPPASRGRLRKGISVALTVLAALLVWFALVAPDQPQYLHLNGFLRLPLELLGVIALALVLPRTPRRIMAVTAGLLLTLVVVLKIINYGVFKTFDRPFDPLGDTAQVGTGIQTLRSIIGPTETRLIEVAVPIGLVAMAVVLVLSMLRLTRVAADNRQWALRAVTGVGALWALCWVFGAQLISHTPIASTISAGLMVDDIHALQADIHDQAVFAAQIKHDPLRNIPDSRLLTRLRGKDVLLVFVESYGQVSVQGSSFSPAIDSLLAKGTRRLQTAGFSARSAFLNAPGFGGISWLAHSTLQSGVWANTQQRYDQLVASHRLTLSDAFNRAGWRSVNFAPADDPGWRQGWTYYHYAKLYDRGNMGYHGPRYDYAPMPDQYMFAALQRLELAKTHRRPVFAEVDTVSSHMPWDRIPEMIPWNKAGNGSIFYRTPTLTEPSSFWWHPDQVKAAYARSLEYSLNTLISYVRHYGSKKLVLVVVGDEQPLAIVSGSHANRDVPISIIARDPSVLKRIGGWDWESGLLPHPNAPVWRMSAFRNRFLTAFDSPPAAR